MDFKISPIVVFVVILIVYVATLQLAGASLGFVLVLSQHFFYVFNFCLLSSFRDKVYECRDINACWCVFKPCHGFVATFLSCSFF